MKKQSHASKPKKRGGRDFGVSQRDTIETQYTSENTKRSDRGNATPRSGTDESCTSGVGGNASGIGASSGGDVDADDLGLERPGE